jgi:hypothetical protein
MADLCSKLCSLKENDVEHDPFLKGKRRERDKSTNGIKERKKGSEE